MAKNLSALKMLNAVHSTVEWAYRAHRTVCQLLTLDIENGLDGPVYFDELLHPKRSPEFEFERVENVESETSNSSLSSECKLKLTVD
ncbi:hypothetical protein EVAR_78746_1 [Eumeta japonica]|uniref:Uncharacterized protein n=1 Tax=Eumeta variegata TaxID=151549 RepID=A0A4C1T476_EUMVA|nr:hypothetical protein EVAR_78746_1 [Eumeta japonica]